MQGRHGRGATPVSRRRRTLVIALAALGLAIAGLAPALAAHGSHATRDASAGSAARTVSAGYAAPAVSSGRTSDAVSPTRAAAAAGQARTQAPAFVAKPHAVTLPPGESQVCGLPSQPGQMACQAVLAAKGAGAGPAAAASSVSGYGPSSLRSAYNLQSASADRGSGETIAIVDAYNNPDLARNLATYRKHFGLPACTTSSGCLRILNQSGKAKPLPAGNADWGIEEANDLDMVSAICPRCSIVLVEAKSASVVDLGIAEDTAIAKGARFVSNSWSGGEFVGQDAYDHYFNHPGDAIVFAAGDYGYGPQYPTDSQYVTAVGGTTLIHKKSGSRSWTESVWGSATVTSGTGSGCSALEAKPSWQRADDTSPTGCLNRTENDVSAVGDPSTGVAIYDTYDTGATFFTVGGTSVATPIITAVYALAGTPARGTYPASYLYRHSSSDFHHVTSGVNGTCEADRQYLCHGEHGFGGYNGPAGLGTPKGTAAFSSSGVDPVTVLDPGTQDGEADASFGVTVHAVDNDSKAKSLSYSASGLPAGLAIKSAHGSLNARISGTLPSSVPADGQGYAVTVTAKDTRTGHTASTRFEIYVVGSLTTATGIGPGPGQLEANAGGSESECLSAASATAGVAVVMDSCGDASVSQDWQYFSGAAPGSAGSVQIATGICLAISGGDAVLATCDGSASQQQWEVSPTTSAAGEPTSYLYNPASNECLNGGSLTVAGQQAVASACSSAYGEDWALDVAVASGLTGQCMSAGSSAPVSAACASGDSDEYWQTYGGVFSGSNGCLAESGMLDGDAAGYESCADVLDSADGYWVPGPGGELINLNSGRCLDNPGSGEGLVQEDCYGLPGEIWALN